MQEQYGRKIIYRIGVKWFLIEFWHTKAGVDEHVDVLKMKVKKLAKA